MSSLDFNVENQQGESAVVDDAHVVQQLKGMGYPVSGVSADGMHITFQDPQQGQYQVKTSDALKEMGWNVKGTLPSNPDYDNIQHEWRLGLESLPPDDDMRKSYLEAKLKRNGVQMPQLVGSGSDWHVFNPQTSQWVALTNKPGLDVSDLAEAGAAVPHFLGAALGGTAGGLLGGPGGPVGMIAGGAAGAGVGGGLGDAAGRFALAQFDPDFRNVAAKNFGAVAGDVGKTAALDAGTFGALKALGVASPALRTLMAKGPISTAARTLGAGAEGAGALSSGAAGAIARSPLATNLATSALPGVGDVANAGWMAELPGAAVRAVPKAMNALGTHPVTAPLFGEEGAAALQRAARRLAAPRGGQGVAETIARGLGGQGRTQAVQGTSDVLGNAFEGAANGLGYSDAAAGAGRFGEGLGSGLGHLENLGKLGSEAATHATRAGLRGIQAGGNIMRGAGGALRNAATIAQPLEVPAFARYGAGRAEESLRRLRRDPLDDIMDESTTLATNY